MNITSLQVSSEQQCYLDTFSDLSSTLQDSSIPAYYCYCNDRTGCNNADKTFFNKNFVNILLIFSVGLFLN